MQKSILKIKLQDVAYGTLTPVVQHGPFVMNTQEEIQATFSDYQKTQFGGWPYDTNSPVNPIDKGRFAKYSDGNEEIRE